MLTVSTFAILAAVVIAWFIKWYLERKEANKRLPPGPRGLPLLGVFPLIQPSTAHLRLTKWTKEYGPIFSFYNGSKLIVIISDLQILREAYQKQGEVFSGRPGSYHGSYTHKNHGVLENDGPLWKEQRRFALSTLRDFGVGKPILENRIREEAHWLCKELETLAGKSSNPKVILNNAVSNVICSIIFGKRFDYKDAKFMQLLKNFGFLASENNQNHFSFGHYFPLFMWFPILWLGFAEAMRRWRSMEAFCMELIREHEASFDPEEEPTDYIHAFMAAKLKNPGPESTFFDFQLLQSVVSMFIAGTETTSSTLRWAILFLAQRPAVQDRVRAEIHDVIGTADFPSMSDRQKMPYTEATLCEIQRVSNLVPSVPHRAHEETELAGYRIPKDVGVVGLLWYIHRDPANFKDPLDFNPDRFLDESGKVLRTDALIPFCVGKRVCLGESLARMELFLLFTTLFQKFRWEFKNGYTGPKDYEHDRFVGFTSPPIDFDVQAIPI